MWSEGHLGLLICGIITVVLLMRRRCRGDGFPPGPFAWPVIGHLHLLSNLPHQALREVAKKHGHIVGLRLGQQRAVVVSSPELAKEVLLTLDNVFADRPPFEFVSTLLFGSTSGIIFSNYGPEWRMHRKICMLHLFTTKRLQELRHVWEEEVCTLLHSIHDQSAGGTIAVDLGRSVGHMSSRLLMRLLFSSGTTHVGDEDLQQLIKEEEQEAAPTIGDLIPSLSWLDFFKKKRMRHIHARIEKLYAEILMKRKERGSVHDDLLHAFLSQENSLTPLEIKSILHDVMAAGIHTTALTLEWSMAELLRNPHSLYRLQREIETQLGEKKQVITANLPTLNYLKCVVKEIARLHPVVPLLLPRVSRIECKVHGYTIPTKTLMFVNTWAMGRDEQVWPNANEFMPERFEGKDIDVKGQHFELLPFGSGRRICLGLPLALSVIELTLANIVSCFDWELPGGATPTSINMEEKKGITANKATPVMAIPKLRVPLSKLSNM